MIKDQFPYFFIKDYKDNQHLISYRINDSRLLMLGPEGWDPVPVIEDTWGYIYAEVCDMLQAVHGAVSWGDLLIPVEGIDDFMDKELEDMSEYMSDFYFENCDDTILHHIDIFAYVRHCRNKNTKLFGRKSVTIFPVISPGRTDDYEPEE